MGYDQFHISFDHGRFPASPPQTERSDRFHISFDNTVRDAASSHDESPEQMRESAAQPGATHRPAIDIINEAFHDKGTHLRGEDIAQKLHVSDLLEALQRNSHRDAICSTDGDSLLVCLLGTDSASRSQVSNQCHTRKWSASSSNSTWRNTVLFSRDL